MLPDNLKPLADPDKLPAAIAALNAYEDPHVAAKAYLDLTMHFYWERKNLPAVITLTQPALEHVLNHAQRLAASDPEKSLELRQAARALTYNLASFCWPGWNEPGITITEREAAAGMNAIQRHVEILETLNPDDLTRSRATWMLAAHHLTGKAYDQAVHLFTRAAQLAAQAGNPAETLLSRGFSILAQDLKQPALQTESQLEQLKNDLRTLKEGPDFIAQLETAECVCRLRS